MNETNRYFTSADQPEALEELERLNDKLDRVMNAIALLDRRREDLEEMLADLLPAANGAMRVATNRLWELETTGTLDLAREGVTALRTASQRIDPDDLRALGNQADLAIRTMRTLTAPEVVAASEHAVQALQSARTGKPPGLFRLLRRLRTPHVRRGLGAVLDILTGLGGSARTNRPVLEEPQTAARGGRPPVLPPPTTTATANPPAGPSVLEVQGRSVALDPDGYLADPAAWTPEVAAALAAQAGIAPLEDDHWRVLEFCRADAGSAGTAPGLRRITKELGIPPKDMYRLFPNGPGRLAARVAGLGKPKSCV